MNNRGTDRQTEKGTSSIRKPERLCSFVLTSYTCTTFLLKWRESPFHDSSFFEKPLVLYTNLYLLFITYHSSVEMKVRIVLGNWIFFLTTKNKTFHILYTEQTLRCPRSASKQGVFAKHRCTRGKYLHLPSIFPNKCVGDPSAFMRAWLHRFVNQHSATYIVLLSAYEVVDVNG